MPSLWGPAFDVPKKEATKKIIEKTKTQKAVKSKTVKQVVESKSVSNAERVRLITENVNKILGHYKDQTICITSRDDLLGYIAAANKEKILAIDTETNNSLDPLTCKLMGLCLFTPGQKNCYVPVNHVDLTTGVRLDEQLTETDILDALNTIAPDTVCIFHNGKFDYQVIKCTCKYTSRIDWDTMVGAKILDENEFSAGLKQQYISKINPDQEKYNIEHLFEKQEYAIFPPEVFALYSATDSFMTYELYKYQKKEFEKSENSSIFKLFLELEMPLVPVIAEMEMSGIYIDQDYAARLKNKYHKLVDKANADIENDLISMSEDISRWRLTPDANEKILNKKTGKLGKSKNEQLSDPVVVSSPTQLAILLFDILKCPVVNRDKPRSTGESDLLAIQNQVNLPLIDHLLTKRHLDKLISTYIDVIPELAMKNFDKRIRTSFQQYGAATGRLSSSTPINFQNIPSKNREIRLLFTAKTDFDTVVSSTDEFTVKRWNDVETLSGWVVATELKVGDTILVDNEPITIKKIVEEGYDIEIFI